MVRRKLCPLLLSLVSLCLVGPSAPPIQAGPLAGATNLLVNSGFEEGNFSPAGAPTGWSTAQYTPGHAQFIWDNTQVHGGGKSVQISATQPDDARWLQVVNVQPDTYYELSGWIRTENVPTAGGGGANLSVESSSSPFLGRSAKQTGTGDWRSVRVVFGSGLATQVTISGRLGDYAGVTTGAAWFDDLELRVLSALDFKVTPVLLRPNDFPPIAHALPWIDTHMQWVQGWYGEQLRDRTFRLEAAHEVVGNYALAHYYGTCFPLGEGCVPDWGQQLFNNIMADLETLGYANQPDQVVVVFFQSDGGRAAALGGGRRALVGLPPENLISDNTHIGSHFMVDLGGLAHELGHGFGLAHTLPDAEDSPSKSLMQFGFYNFPQATLVNTATNRERDLLIASGFFSNSLLLKDGGFEDCLVAWKVTKGQPGCAGNGQQRSGLTALQFTATSQQYALEQDAVVAGATPYDLSGWVKVDAPASGLTVQVALQALSSTKNVLKTFTVKSLTNPTDGWERFAATLTLPADAAFARLQLSAQGKTLAAWVDGLALQSATQPPPAPLPVFYNDGQAVAGLQPKLQWSDAVQASLYRVQIATNPEFSLLLTEALVTSPFMTPPALPAFDRYYFWRVKAINGNGESAWSPVWSLVPRPPARFYNDEFESGVLSSPWFWHSTAPSGFGFSSPPNRQGGYLSIPMPVGDLDDKGAPRRLLLRPAPAGDFAVNTLSEAWKFSANPNWAGIHEERGLVLYQDDDNYVRIAQGYADSYQLSWVAKVQGVLVAQERLFRTLPIPLQLVRKGNTYSGFYTMDGINWRPLGQSVTAQWSNVRMGLFAYHTTADNEASTAYFNRFRVTNPCYAVTATVANQLGGAVEQSRETCASGGYRGEAPVTLTATSASGYQFGGWQGGATGKANPLTLPVLGDLQISAVFYTYGLEAAPSAAQAGDPGATVVYALPVRNTGNTTDTYQVVVSNNGWNTAAPALLGPLEPNASTVLTAAVQIPAQVLAGATDSATLLITSQGDASRAVTRTLTTTANAISGVAATAAIHAQSAAPQASVVYAIEVTNLGNIADTFNLTQSGNQWPLTLPATLGPLQPGEIAHVGVIVTIPAGMAAGASDAALLTFTAQRNSSKSASLTLTTSALASSGVSAFAPKTSQSAAAGDAVTYQVQVTNHGNTRETFSIHVTSTWSVTAPSLIGPLDPGASITFDVVVRVPLTAAATDKDLCRLTITAQSSPGQTVTVQLETQVETLGAVNRLFLPILAQTARQE